MTVSAVLFLIFSAATVISARMKNVAEGRKPYVYSTPVPRTVPRTKIYEYSAKKASDRPTNHTYSTIYNCRKVNTETDNWWYVDLGRVYDKIRKIRFYSNLHCCTGTARQIRVLAGVELDSLSHVDKITFPAGTRRTLRIDGGVVGRYVGLVHEADNGVFHYCEVRVIAEM